MNDFLTDYLQSLHGIPVLTHEEEYSLADRIAKGDDAAVDKLVRHNLRFVIFIIRKLASWNHSRVPQEDLIGFGNEGLFKAAKKWKPTNGARFATYAKQFIIRAVERGLDNTENIVRVPIKVREEIRKMAYTERAMTNKLGRVPSMAELSSELDKDQKRISQLKFFMLQEPSSLDAINSDKLEDEHDHD